MGCNEVATWVPVLQCCCSLKILQEFRVLTFTDDITVIFAPENAWDTTGIAKVTLWLQEYLALEGIQLNRSTSQALLARSINLGNPSETQREETAATQLKIVGPGMRIVDVSAGTEAFQR